MLSNIAKNTSLFLCPLNCLLLCHFFHASVCNFCPTAFVKERILSSATEVCIAHCDTSLRFVCSRSSTDSLQVASKYLGKFKSSSAKSEVCISNAGIYHHRLWRKLELLSAKKEYFLNLFQIDVVKFRSLCTIHCKTNTQLDIELQTSKSALLKHNSTSFRHLFCLTRN